MGDALIDVWFSLLGLSYSLAHTYKVLKKLFFSCTVDFKRGGNNRCKCAMCGEY